jgi:hypothetical protein
MTVKYLEQSYSLEERPLWWHERGLLQTASGYGKKLTSARVARLSDGRVRRVYVTQYSNAGTAWIILDGERHIVIQPGEWGIPLPRPKEIA